MKLLVSCTCKYKTGKIGKATKILKIILTLVL